MLYFAIRSDNFDILQLPRTVKLLFVVAPLLVILIIAIRPLRELSRKLGKQLFGFGRNNIKLILILLTVLTLIYQMALIAFIYARPGWDPGRILLAVQNDGVFLGAPDYLSASPDYVSTHYLSIYPNNRFFYFLMHFISSITGGVHLRVWQVFSAFCVDLSILLTSLVARNRFGKNYGYLTYLFGILLIGLTPQLYLPYTDTMVLPLVAAGLYLLTRHDGTDILTRLIWQGGLLSVVVALTYLMKASAVIPFIAVLIIGIFRLFSKEKKIALARKGLLIYTVFAFAGLALTVVAFETYSANQSITPINKEEAFPATHFIMMGLAGEGYWNPEDVITTLDAGDKNQKTRVNLSVISQRLDEYGAKGYASFLLRKFRNNTADGTLGWGSEGGHLTITEEPGKPVSLPGEIIKSLYSSDGNAQSIFRFYSQIIWILTLAAMLLASKTRDDFSAMLKLSLIGALVFLLLFEGGRSRYLIQFLPMISILASLGCMRFSHALKDFLPEQANN
jgi:integral membrane protein (TIGR03766 family)